MIANANNVMIAIVEPTAVLITCGIAALVAVFVKDLTATILRSPITIATPALVYVLRLPILIPTVPCILAVKTLFGTKANVTVNARKRMMLIARVPKAVATYGMLTNANVFAIPNQTAIALKLMATIPIITGSKNPAVANAIKKPIKFAKNNTTANITAGLAKNANASVMLKQMPFAKPKVLAMCGATAIAIACALIMMTMIVEN